MGKNKPERLVDIVVPAPYPGPQVPMQSILEREVTVLAYELTPSQFSERLPTLKISLKVDRKVCWVATSSIFLIEFFERVVPERLPATCTFTKGPDDEGNYIYTVK